MGLNGVRHEVLGLEDVVFHVENGSRARLARQRCIVDEDVQGSERIDCRGGEPIPTLNGDAVRDTPKTLADGDRLGIFGIEIAFRRP